MTLGLIVLATSTAVAVDMDTLPAQYGLAPPVVDGGSEHTRHPSPDVTLPFLEGAEFCGNDAPSSTVLAPVSGEPQLAGDAPPLLLADADARVGDVLRGLSPQPLRAGFVADVARPPTGTWCALPMQITGSPQGDTVTSDDLQQSGLPGRIWQRIRDGKQATFAVPPDAPWADAVASYHGLLRLQGRDVAPSISLYIDPSAPSLPHADRHVGEYDPPTRTDITVVDPSGQPLAHFETPTRLVHTSGVPLALFQDGAIVVAGSDGTAKAFEMSTLAAPRFERFGTLAIVDGAIGEWERDGAYRYIDDPIGRVNGEPYLVQRMMLQLGLEQIELVNIAITGLADAMPDGELRLSFDAPGRWSADGIQLADSTYRLTDLSTLVETPDGPQMRCKTTPEAVDGVTVTLHHALRGEDDEPLPIRAAGRALDTLDHPQVRAACIGAAYTLATFEAARDRGEEAEVVGGVIGGRTGLTIPSVHHSRVRVRRQFSPEYPPEARGEYSGVTDCRVEVTIDETGTPSHVAPQDCPDVFFAAAESAVFRGRWYPHRVNGAKTAARFIITFRFDGRR